MSSRHLYTGHRRGHIQAAPRLRAHRGGPLSRDHPQIPVSMPSLFRFDASAVVHTCSSSHRTPAPLTARRHPQRSPPRLLTDAACGGLESPPARRPRRTYLHHWHSTDRADDLLHHHHHFPSGHTWVPETRPWSLTCRDGADAESSCTASCTDSSLRWFASLYLRAARSTSPPPQRRRNPQSANGQQQLRNVQRHAAAASSTNTEEPPDQPRHSFGHPHAALQLGLVDVQEPRAVALRFSYMRGLSSPVSEPLLDRVATLAHGAGYLGHLDS